MASMRFCLQTVGTLMSLVDEHKDELKESEYIEICNLLKHVHNQQSSRPAPRPVPNHIPTPTPPNTVPAHVTAAITGIQFTLTELRERLNKNGRVTVGDKLVTLRSLLTTHSVEHPTHLGLECQQAQVRRYLEKVQVHLPTIGTRDLTRMYREKRDERVAREKGNIRNNTIPALERRLEHLRQISTVNSYTI